MLFSVRYIAGWVGNSIVIVSGRFHSPVDKFTMCFSPIAVPMRPVRSLRYVCLLFPIIFLLYIEYIII